MADTFDVIWRVPSTELAQAELDALVQLSRTAGPDEGVIASTTKTARSG